MASQWLRALPHTSLVVILCACARKPPSADATPVHSTQIASTTSRSAPTTKQVTATAISASSSSGITELHSDGDGCAAHAQPLREPPPGASATSLRVADAAKVTSFTVSAHQGVALLRRQPNGEWAAAGKRGCSVSTERVRTALENLTRLNVQKRHDVWPADAKFELQIDVLMGEEHAIHLEVGPRRGGADLVKLLSDDVVEVTGLDRGLWSVDPAAWCSPP